MTRSLHCKFEHEAQCFVEEMALELLLSSRRSDCFHSHVAAGEKLYSEQLSSPVQLAGAASPDRHPLLIKQRISPPPPPPLLLLLLLLLPTSTIFPPTITIIHPLYFIHIYTQFLSSIERWAVPKPRKQQNAPLFPLLYFTRQRTLGVHFHPRFALVIRPSLAFMIDLPVQQYSRLRLCYNASASVPKRIKSGKSTRLSTGDMLTCVGTGNVQQCSLKPPYE